MQDFAGPSTVAMERHATVVQGVQGVGVGNVNVQNVQPQEDGRIILVGGLEHEFYDFSYTLW